MIRKNPVFHVNLSVPSYSFGLQSYYIRLCLMLPPEIPFVPSMTPLPVKITTKLIREDKNDYDGNENRAFRTSEQGETNKAGFHGVSVVE